MTDDDVRAFHTVRRVDAAARRRSDMWSTVIASTVAAVLAYWAFQSVPHAVLFAFVVFSVSTVGNRIIWELRDQQLADDERRLVESQDAGKRSDPDLASSTD